jgi:hypothetical protein
VHRCLGGHRWWCFDAYLADGAKLVMSFMEKDLGQPQKPLSPLLRLNLELPDGRIFDKAVRYPPSEWSAAKDHADVHLSKNQFTGDLHQYRTQATVEDISVDATLTGQVPPCQSVLPLMFAVRLIQKMSSGSTTGLSIT